jgi:hypothetical protein
LNKYKLQKHLIFFSIYIPCEILIQNLLKIVNHTNSVLTGIYATLNIPKEQRRQLVLHKQDEHISKKNNLWSIFGGDIAQLK